MILYALTIDADGVATPSSLAVGGERSGIADGPDGIRLDLDRIPASVLRIICAADHATVSPPTPRDVPLVVSLTGDETPSAFVLSIEPSQVHPAMICFELYRRDGGWKVRAVGQGYGGGRDELLTVHGIESAVALPRRDDLGSAPERPPYLPTGGPEPLERIWMILEDAARSTAGFTAARDYAAARLDEDLSAAVADPATRNSVSARRAADDARARHDHLIAEAQSRYEADATYLHGELQDLDAVLPPSLASWKSPVWKSEGTESAACNAVRLGELFAADVGQLRVPFCVTAPLRRPVWIGADDSAAALPVVTALVLRLLAATPTPKPELDVVDLTGALQPLSARLAMFMPRAVIRDHRSLTAGLEYLTSVVDLAILAADAEHRKAPASIVVLSDFGYGLDHEVIGPLARLISMVEHGRLSIVVIGERPRDAGHTDSFAHELFSLCQYVPVGFETVIADPWTGGEWQFNADTLTDDWHEPLAVVTRLVSQ